MVVILAKTYFDNPPKCFQEKNPLKHCLSGFFKLTGCEIKNCLNLFDDLASQRCHGCLRSIFYPIFLFGLEKFPAKFRCKQ